LLHFHYCDICTLLVSALQLHEAWDLLESMKKMVDDDRGRARSLLEAHPQLIGAFIEVQVSKYVRVKCVRTNMYVRAWAVIYFSSISVGSAIIRSDIPR
jgi:hypothetical protein